MWIIKSMMKIGFQCQRYGLWLHRVAKTYNPFKGLVCRVLGFGFDFTTG